MQNDNAKIKTDLKKRAYLYALRMIKLVDHSDRKTVSTEIIMKQLLRSATSIGANIIEAQAASSKKDFTNFFNHALKSANESKFWLGLLRDSGKEKSENITALLQETNELANMLGASIVTLRSKRN